MLRFYKKEKKKGKKSQKVFVDVYSLNRYSNDVSVVEFVIKIKKKISVLLLCSLFDKDIKIHESFNGLKNFFL